MYTAGERLEKKASIFLRLQNYFFKHIFLLKALTVITSSFFVFKQQRTINAKKSKIKPIFNGMIFLL